MKRAAFLLPFFALFLLTACAPQAGAEIASSPTTTPTVAATATATRTVAPTLNPTVTASSTPTASPTPIPTLPPQQLGGLTGIPDPCATAPELFDLRDSAAPIP